MLRPKFNPTQAQIEACRRVIIATAFYGPAKEKHDELQTLILSTGHFHYDEKYYTDEKYMNIAKRCEFPADRIIRNGQDVCHIDGLSKCGTPEFVDSDADVYFRLLDEAARKLGFVNGNNFECMAHNDLLDAENAFLEVTKDIHQLDLDRLWGENRKQLLDLLLNLYVPLASADRQTLEQQQRAYYDERVIEPMQTV